MNISLNVILPLQYHSIWDENHWFPENITWDDNTYYRHAPSSFWHILTATIVIHLVHQWVTKNVSIPFAKSLGLKVKVIKPSVPSNLALEKEYQLWGKNLLNSENLYGMVKKGLGTEREIEKWFRSRTTWTKPSTLSKFLESHWKFLWYCSICTVGLYSLWNVPWFWDSEMCINDMFSQTVPAETKCYLILATGYCITELLILLKGNRRKDYWQMAVHHVVTLLLLTVTYFINVTRMASIVLFLHDFGDIFMHLAKLCDYGKFYKLHITTCILFVIVWTLTRIIILPYIAFSWLFATRIYHCTIRTAFILSGITVQILNVIWSYYIYKSLFTIFNKDVVYLRDTRSSGEESD